MSKWLKPIGVICLISITAIIISFIILIIPTSSLPFTIMIDYSNDWIGFWGNIAGAIISGSITLIALIKTIEFERVKEFDNQRIQLMPYLKFTLLSKKENTIMDDDGSIGNYLLTPKNFKPQNSTFKPDVNAQLIIENFGLNSAVELSVLEVIYDGITDISHHEEPILEVRGQSKINFSVVAPNDIKMDTKTLESNSISAPIQVKIGYSDLLGHYYEQSIILRCSSDCSYKVNEDKSISDICYYYTMSLYDVPKSEYIRDKDIKVEKFKRIDEFFMQNKEVERITKFSEWYSRIFKFIRKK